MRSCGEARNRLERASHPLLSERHAQRHEVEHEVQDSARSGEADGEGQQDEYDEGYEIHFRMLKSKTLAIRGFLLDGRRGFGCLVIIGS